MGAFLVNFHVRSDDVERVSAAVEQALDEGGWMTEPHAGWISFWEERASRQDTDRIAELAENVSRSAQAPLIAFLVHDSDMFCYWLYDAGVMRDHFNSCPSYWGDDTIDEAALAADVAELRKYCRPETQTEELEAIVVQDSQANAAAGKPPAFTFAEERLTRLAPLLGLNEDVVLSDFGTIDDEIDAEEIAARWVGTERSPQPKAELQQPRGSAPLPHGPLHAAAQRDDIEAIEKLVADGADINEIPTGYQVTALTVAAGHGTPATIRRLVELGADIHEASHAGASPIRFAVQAGKLENVRLLVELGADVADNNVQIGNLLHLATIMQQPPETIRVLLEIGVDPNFKNQAGLRPVDIVRANLESFEQMRKLFQMSGSKPTQDHQERLNEHQRRIEESAQLLMKWTT